MAVWFLATFALAQAGKIIPMIGFSPQIGTPLLGPLAILGCSVHLPGAFKDKPKYHVYAAGILLAAIILTGNIAMLQYTIKTTEKDKDQTKYYADKCEANRLGLVEQKYHAGASGSCRPGNFIKNLQIHQCIGGNGALQRYTPV